MNRLAKISTSMWLVILPIAICIQDNIRIHIDIGYTWHYLERHPLRNCITVQTDREHNKHSNIRFLLGLYTFLVYRSVKLKSSQIITCCHRGVTGVRITTVRMEPSLPSMLRKSRRQVLLSTWQSWRLILVCMDVTGFFRFTLRQYGFTTCDDTRMGTRTLNAIYVQPVEILAATF